MRTSVSTFSRPTTTTTPPTSTSTNIPTIRLITATPSASGSSTSPSPANSFDIPSPLLPRVENSPKKRLVPKKKSKLSLLGSIGGREKDRDRDKDKGKDLSDVLRRVGAPPAPASARGFEIYVDPADDPEIGEIVIVKRKKSRAALESVRWGPGALGEVTNTSVNTGANMPHEMPTREVLKMKGEEKGEGKWWSIGRGRKDSKEKEKTLKFMATAPARPTSPDPEPTAPPSTSSSSRDSHSRTRTPEPFNPSRITEADQVWFNSLDSGILFSSPVVIPDSPSSSATPRASKPHSRATALSFREQHRRYASESSPSPPLTYSRAGTPTAGGLFGPTTTPNNQNSGGGGSIALRAMRSVQSLARIRSWAHMKGEEGVGVVASGSVRGVPPKDKQKEKSVKEGKTKEGKKSKSKKENIGNTEMGTVKKKKVKKENAENTEEGTVKKSKSKSKSKSKTKGKMDKGMAEDEYIAKDKDNIKAGTDTPDLSSSSFEIGSLSPMLPRTQTETQSQTLGQKKRSILGLGLPSGMSMSMRLPKVRSSSSSSSTIATANVSSVTSNTNGPRPAAVGRLSVESAAHMFTMGRDRASSTSTSSSLRPMSVMSTVSGVGSRHSSGSGGSIRWDEERLESVVAIRRRERLEREREREKVREMAEVGKDAKGKKDKKGSKKENKHSGDGKRRTPLSEVFLPDADAQRIAPKNSSESVRYTPIVTAKAATADGHYDESRTGESVEGDAQGVTATPMRRARERPLSEHSFSTTRPKAMYESDDSVISILDAATNDLAQLINNLDLEATPGTPDLTPLKPSRTFLPPGGRREDVEESPTKRSPQHRLASTDNSLGKSKSLRHDVPSVSSLRPYAQSRRRIGASADTNTNADAGKGTVSGTNTVTKTASTASIGMQIAPWPTLVQSLSPVKDSPARATVTAASVQPLTIRPKHKRSSTPGPEPEPAPVFQPLRPAKSRPALKAPSNSSFSMDDKESTIRASSTFGQTNGSAADKLFSSPIFKRAQERAREHFSKKSSGNSYQVRMSISDADSENNTVPIPPEARRVLGMAGTMGGSDVSAYEVQELDASDPDSDIPDELQFILAGQVDDGDTLSFRSQSPSLSPPEVSRFLPSRPGNGNGPPMMEHPVFHAQLIEGEAKHMDADVYEVDGTSDADTKKSFDFTGEICKLNMSGVSHRRSFVEQLENAFRTPAKVDLKYGLDLGLMPPLPPLPKLPEKSTGTSQGSSELDSPEAQSAILDMKEPTLLHLNMTSQDSAETEEGQTQSKFQLYSQSQNMAINEPTLLPGSDSLASIGGIYEISSDKDDSMSVSDSFGTSSSSGSLPSQGQLNQAFKFGGLPKSKTPQPLVTNEQNKPQTLSDIIPPPSHVRSLSDSSTMDEDDSILKSIFAKASDIPAPQSRLRVNSDSSAKRRAAYRHSRHSSGLSFVGFDSFDEFRRGFEFGSDRAPFYPPPASRRNNYGRPDSLLSIASVSSYGRVINYGSNDPFDYGLPSLRERPSSEDMTMMTSTSIDDTFSFMHNRPRKRVESDASSFYFKAPMQSFNRGHHRQESNMSIASHAPPISRFNRPAHRRNDSNTSVSSAAQSYAAFGATSKRSTWAKYRPDSYIDSLSMDLDTVSSDFSAMRLGRPGVGDKMFDTAMDYGAPLPAISASPSESIVEPRFENRTSFDYDSIIDDDERMSSTESSFFEKTGRGSSESSDSSVFGNNERVHASLLPPDHFRPLSVLSCDNSIHSPMRDGDTMISMLGGGHVRRLSVEATPCPRIEKRKHSVFQAPQTYHESPKKARIIEKPSIASTSSYTFGGERMIKARRGLLERQSLEESALAADGEDLSGSFHFVPVFSRPGPVGRSRSSTCTTSSSGSETPPLSSSDGASTISEGSQSSIDLSQLNDMLSNVTHPVSTTAQSKARARAHGHGHRRRISQARASRSSVYETIEEEMTTGSSPAQSLTSTNSTPTTCQPIFIVDSDAASKDTLLPETSVWDDERGIVALRKYYALRDEAQDTVIESKQQWLDTPFSVFALQSFQPPRHPAGMQALLEHSVQNYGPLPSELRPRRMRSRTQSRPSPYPQAQARAAIIKTATPPSPQVYRAIPDTRRTPVLQQIPINHNSNVAMPAASTEFLKPLVTDVEPKHGNAFGMAAAARPRVGSTAHQSAFGWTKRSTGKSSTDQKENVVGHGSVTTPGDGLRLSRPRPRGRTTPASQQRTTRF